MSLETITLSMHRETMDLDRSRRILLIFKLNEVLNQTNGSDKKYIAMADSLMVSEYLQSDSKALVI